MGIFLFTRPGDFRLVTKKEQGNAGFNVWTCGNGSTKTKMGCSLFLRQY
jgi:hypothetical protein